MKIHVVSDLHLEFGQIPHLPGGDMLLLAGDTVVTDHLVNNKRGHRDVAELFFEKHVSKYDRAMVVMGNHEHYHGCIDDSATIYRRFLSEVAPHAKLLDDQTEVIDGIAFIGSTLWAPCRRGTNAISELAIGIRMSDFRVIRKAEPGSTYTAAFTPADARARHEKAVAYIFDEAKKHRRVVVMTHHAPSYMSAFGHASDKLTPACCSNLDEQILDHPQIELWVHGHTHQSERYMIGKTKVLANQCGYPHERCSTQFKVKDGEFELNTAEAVT